MTAAGTTTPALATPRRIASAASSSRAGVRVCVVAPSMAVPGGQAMQALRLREQLAAMPGTSVSFVATNPPPPRGLRPLARVRYVRTLVTFVRYAGSLVRQLRACDVVHVFSPSYWAFIVATLPAMLVARAYGKAVLLNYHSGEAEDHLARWRATLPLMLRLAHRIVVPSDYLVHVFARAGIEASAIENFVDTARPAYRRRAAGGGAGPVVLANRSLEPLYNVPCVLRAFALVQAAHPGARLVVAGDGTQRGALEALAAELGLRDVTFTGSVTPERMAELYDAADVYANASNIDNMPLSIIEAFSAGLPVVTTAAGGIPYIVGHERTGLLVPCGDEGALARGIERLVREPALAQRMAEAARTECVARYGWLAVRERWRACYAELAAEARIARADTSR